MTPSHYSLKYANQHSSEKQNSQDCIIQINKKCQNQKLCYNSSLSEIIFGTNLKLCNLFLIPWITIS